jgi:glycosyltransferase involved in cell wall biosynthesis
VNDSKPTVSIILPTYNRAKFLPEAFAAIRGQTWTDWELIVVDDGSSDDTRALIPELTRGWQQPVHYIYQENQGAYGARNTGLDHATGKYIAFYDSDDLWLPHHLSNCVEALDANLDVDWVYGACRTVDHFSGEVLVPNTLHSERGSNSILQLPATRRGNVCVLATRALQSALFRVRLFNGLQNSLIRASAFCGNSLDTRHRNEVADSLFCIRQILKGATIAYLDNVHVIYRVHDSNSSGAGASAQRLERVVGAALRGYEDLLRESDLPIWLAIRLRKLIADIGFWHLGYAVHWENGLRSQALSSFRQALCYWPLDLRKWKTFVVCAARASVGR